MARPQWDTPLVLLSQNTTTVIVVSFVLSPFGWQIDWLLNWTWHLDVWNSFSLLPLLLMSMVWTSEENMQPTVDKSIELKKIRADMEGKVVWVLVSRKTFRGLIHIYLYLDIFHFEHHICFSIGYVKLPLCIMCLSTYWGR